MSKDQMVGKSEDRVNQNSDGLKRRDLLLSGSSLVAASALMGAGVATPAQAQLPARTPPSGQQPNIVVIMGDDIGWSNIGAYHQGLMYSTTPNLDKLAAEGMRFTDYYAEPSCTAGRANFITGELPIRTGLTTVGQAGATVGMPDQAPTIATALKAMGYDTGQFGKNHLGDLNRYLPTVHGFDEYFGYLYHLDAMEDPFWHSYPPALKDTVGPRNLVHSFATTTRRSDGGAAVGQGRQAEDRGRGAAAAASHAGHQVQHGDDRRGHSRLLQEVHRQGQSGRQAVLLVDESHARARHLASVAEISGEAHP